MIWKCGIVMMWEWGNWETAFLFSDEQAVLNFFIQHSLFLVRYYNKDIGSCLTNRNEDMKLHFVSCRHEPRRSL